MANCDWGRPCDCSDCRTKYFDIKCPHCGFDNALQVEGGNAQYTVDRKGLGGYDFTYPSGTEDLICYCCSKNIPNVPNYDSYNRGACDRNMKCYQNKLKGLICSSCGVVEEESKGFSTVKLKRFDDNLYCEDCIVEVGKNKIPNPSNENEKYIFCGSTMKWELDKVRIECPSCNRKRWLNPENKWRKKCKNCYFANRK